MVDLHGLIELHWIEKEIVKGVIETPPLTMLIIIINNYYFIEDYY